MIRKKVVKSKLDTKTLLKHNMVNNNYKNNKSNVTINHSK